MMMMRMMVKIKCWGNLFYVWIRVKCFLNGRACIGRYLELDLATKGGKIAKFFLLALFSCINVLMF